MTPGEFQAIREYYAWPKGTLKRILGISANSLIAEWEDGIRPIPPYIALLMILIGTIPEARLLAEARANLRQVGRPKKTERINEKN